MRIRRCVWLAALGALALHGAAQAQPLAADGGWAGFTVDANLPPYEFGWIDDNGAPLAFEFSIAAGSQGLLSVVDAGFSGDRFVVIDQRTVLGFTSVPVDGDTNGAITFDYDAAWADANFSRGSWVLGAGSHRITGLLSRSASDAGVPLVATLGGVRLQVSPVPEPATLATLLAGLMLLSVALHRRNDR